MTNGGCLIIPEISYAITPPVTMWSMGKLKLGWKMRRLPSPSPNAPQDMSCQTWPEHHQSHSQQPAVPTLLSPDRIHLTQSDPRLMDSWMEFGDSSTCGSVLEWDNQWVVWGVLTWRVTLVTSWSTVPPSNNTFLQLHLAAAGRWHQLITFALTMSQPLRYIRHFVTSPPLPAVIKHTVEIGKPSVKKRAWQITHHWPWGSAMMFCQKRTMSLITWNLNRLNPIFSWRFPL